MKNAMVVLETDQPALLSYNSSNLLEEILGVIESSGKNCHRELSEISDEEVEFLK